MEKLKRCPFCNGKAQMNKFDFTDSYMIECTNYKCSANIPDEVSDGVNCKYKTKKEAIKAWNKRYINPMENIK